jgi:hypothetical protein
VTGSAGTRDPTPLASLSQGSPDVTIRTRRCASHPGRGRTRFSDTAAALLTLTALFAYLNHRFVRLPSSVGVIALAMAFSLTVTAVGLFVPPVETAAVRLVAEVDFN